MSGEFDELFGRRPSFVERTGRSGETAAPDEATGAQEEQTAGSGAYKPYGFMPGQGLVETCDIQAWMPASETPLGNEVQYRFLVRIRYIGEEVLDLILTDCIIHIEGRHLRDLRKRLSRRQATFIQCHNPMVWREPPVPGEPVITSIDVIYPHELPAPGSAN